MSIVNCTVLNCVKIYVNAKVEMLKRYSLFPMDKLGTRPLSNVKLKLPDNDIKHFCMRRMKEQVSNIIFKFKHHRIYARCLKFMIFEHATRHSIEIHFARDQACKNEIFA